MVVAAGRWDAIESWIYAQKLAAARELVRRRPAAGAVTRIPGAVPSVWRKDLGAEIACELAVTTHAAETLTGLAVVLETRLPLTAAALDAGILNASKARLIADETAVLTDEQAGQAEAEIADKWAGQTWSRIRDLITRAVVNADPEAAIKRREQAEREEARVRFFREHAGTCGLAGYSLPPDEALKASQGINGRARAYRAWGIEGTMEQLRVLAFLDLLTGRDARTCQPKGAPAKSRKAKPGTPHGDGRRGRGTGGAGRGTDTAGQDGDAAGQDGDAAGRASDATGRDEDDWDSLLSNGPADDGLAEDGAQAWDDADDRDQTAQDTTARDDAQDETARDEDRDNDGNEDRGDDARDLEDRGDDGDEDDQDDDGQDGDGQDGDGNGGNGGNGQDGQDGGDGRDGGNGRGPAGPGGAGRDEGLAANVDLVIPLADLTRYAQRAGHAPALGALDPDLARRLAGQAARNPASSFRIIVTDRNGRAIGFGQAGKRRPEAASPPSPSPKQAGDPPDRTAMPPARFTPAGDGPDGGYGTWRLEIGGSLRTVRLHPIQASGECDHRYESAGYQPGPVLRGLVQVRDGECMFPGCGRPASGSDWEHAEPWPAGRSCACNGGIQCHHHNLLKQDPRWTVEQNQDGSRVWITPAALTYTKNTKEYPT